MKKMKITSREIVISTLGSLGAMFIVWVLGLLVSLCIAWVDPTHQIFTKDGFNWSWDTLKILLCTPIPMWVVLTLLSVAAIVVVVCRTLKNPPFLKETEMIVRGLRRTWEWEYDNDEKRYMVCRLNSYCPECDEVLTSFMDGYNCVNGHHYTSNQIGYTIIFDAIVNTLRNKYPKYRNLIGRYHSPYG